MDKRFKTRLFAALAVACGIVWAGCGTEVSEGDLPATKPTDPSQLKSDAKKVMDGMKGMYKGAPR